MAIRSRCTAASIEDECLIGIGAIVLNGARVGKGSVIAAGALVPEGMQIPPGSLVMGVPAKVKREMTPEEQERFRENAQNYVKYRETLPGRALLIRAVKGTRDILPPASSVWNHVEAVARRVFRAYNYREIRTPIFEETALFARGVGEETDIVSKEMYTFDDHGTSLTLRPENTASVIRAYIEHRLDQQPGRAEAVLHRPDVPARAAAEGPITGSSIRSAPRRSDPSRPRRTRK